MSGGVSECVCEYVCVWGGGGECVCVGGACLLVCNRVW